MDLLTSIWLFASVMVVNSGNTINWILKQRPIVFGENAILFCNASAMENCCSNTVTWMRDYDVIVHHGASANNTKYEQRQENDGFSLIIKYFNVNDINHQYTCLYDFYSYSRTLKLNEHDFQRLPKKEEIKSELIQRKENIFSKVIFEEVYPIPTCMLMLNDEKAISCNIHVTEQKIGQFYNATIELVCEMNSTICDGNITLECSFGERKMMIDRKNISVECQLVVPVNRTILSVGIAFAAVFVLSFSVVLTKRRQIRNLCPEGGDTSQRPHLCLYYRQTCSVEDETTPLLKNSIDVYQYASFRDYKLDDFPPVKTFKDLFRAMEYYMKRCIHFALILSTNTEINKARLNRKTEEYNPADWFYRLETAEGQSTDSEDNILFDSDTDNNINGALSKKKALKPRKICSAKDNEVYRLIPVLKDKDLGAILETRAHSSRDVLLKDTNERINRARLVWSQIKFTCSNNKSFTQVSENIDLQTTGKKDSPCLPAQRAKDLKKILTQDNENSALYHLVHITNEKIYEARSKRYTDEYDCTNWFEKVRDI